MAQKRFLGETDIKLSQEITFQVAVLSLWIGDKVT